MEFTLKNIKTFQGNDGEGLNATLYRDGQKVATIHDSANGGEIDFYFTDQKERQTFGEYCETAWAQSDTSKGWRAELRGIKQTTQDWMEGFVNTFVDDYHSKKRLERIAKKKTLFRVEGMAAGEWRSVNSPYSERVLAYLRKTFGETLTEIYGQTLSEAK